MNQLIRRIESGVEKIQETQYGLLNATNSRLTQFMVKLVHDLSEIKQSLREQPLMPVNKIPCVQESELEVEIVEESAPFERCFVCRSKVKDFRKNNLETRDEETEAKVICRQCFDLGYLRRLTTNLNREECCSPSKTRFY